MLEALMTRIKARDTFGSVIARHGFTRPQLGAVSGVSPRTLDALANPPRGREGYTRESTAWKIARGFASKAGYTPEDAFALLFIEVEGDDEAQP